MRLYHGTNFIFDVASPESEMKHANSEGKGLYLTSDIHEASKYGKFIYVFDIQLRQSISLEKVTLSFVDVRSLLRFLLNMGINYFENYGYETLSESEIEYVVNDLIQNSESDVDLIHGIANANDCMHEIMKWMLLHNINYCKHDNIYVLYRKCKPLKIIDTTKEVI